MSLLSTDFRVAGFDATSWSRLVGLFDPRGPADTARPAGLLLVLTDANEIPRVCYLTSGEELDPRDVAPLDDLEALAARHHARRVLVTDVDTMQDLVEAGRARVPLDADWATQALEGIAVLRAWERSDRFRMWPRFGAVSPWTTQNAGRALEVALPIDTTALVCVWEDERVWSTAAVRRAAEGVDRLVGPEHILEWAGPLSGDPQRDHRLLSRGVSRELGPVHVGLFGPRALLLDLTRRAEPGAWAAAVATREVVLQPMPSYAAALVTADTVRAATRWAGRRARDLDLDAVFSPLARTWQARIKDVADSARFEPLAAFWQRWQSSAGDEPGSDD